MAWSTSMFGESHTVTGVILSGRPCTNIVGIVWSNWIWSILPIVRYFSLQCEIEESKPTTNIFAGPLILLKLCDIVRRQQQLRLWRLLQDFQPGDGEEGVGKAQVKSSVARWQHLIPSFPWIAPGWRAGGAIQGKEGIKFCGAA